MKEANNSWLFIGFVFSMLTFFVVLGIVVIVTIFPSMFLLKNGIAILLLCACFLFAYCKIGKQMGVW
ncbi:MULTISPECIES: hypothetical protein [unclassified Psychrobacillus]|uniref:hypothetical protein n=1 Tax=unclassified Psychrobacillus TaxID=2636677 RepID=UPI0030F89A73